MNNQQKILEDQDLVYSYLADQKRIAREYTTAVTESSCPEVRQMFEHLLQDTLNIQKQSYQLMSQQGWYNTSSPVQGQEINKQINQYQQTMQQTSALVQQNLNS
ncbi:MAG: spore coat protein [Anaerobacillus sp.]|uniref:spore coat protein n=1 Tax=Anaerobacillus sp. TaxID=1872506 RepID=UPI00391CFC38